MITNQAVNQAINYIMNHMDEEITIEDVARECHFSKYYFSHLFKEQTGESVYGFMKRVKLEQSAFRLKVERERSVTDIGSEYGYSPSNYSWVFKQHHHISPLNFRKNIPTSFVHHPFLQTEDKKLHSFEEYAEHITVEYLPGMFVIYERRIDNYARMSSDWCDFIDTYQEYMTPQTLLIERTYDDPSITDSKKCLYDICMTVQEDCGLENTAWIEGGKFAVYHFQGYIEELYAAYQGFFNIWLTGSGYRVDKRYGLDIYHEVGGNPLYAVMDLCIPIQ